jgi:hypothetical protein
MAWPKKGWLGHPIFGQWVAGATPYGQSGGGRTTPMAKGWVRPTPKAPPPQKKKQSMGFGLLGVAGPPLWPWGWFNHPQTGRGGGSSHPLAKNGVARATPWLKMGWPEPPPLAKPPLDFLPFFLGGGAFGGGRTTPLAMGVVRPPSDRPWGWL